MSRKENTDESFREFDIFIASLNISLYTVNHKNGTALFSTITLLRFLSDFTLFVPLETGMNTT